MTTDQKLARARKLLAGIKAEFEKGTRGMWAKDSFEVVQGTLKRGVCHCGLGYGKDAESEANALLIAAAHNSLPTALGCIGRYVETLAIEDPELPPSWGTFRDVALDTVLLYLESMAREFGVTGEEGGE